MSAGPDCFVCSDYPCQRFATRAESVYGYGRERQHCNQIFSSVFHGTLTTVRDGGKRFFLTLIIFSNSVICVSRVPELAAGGYRIVLAESVPGTHSQ